MADEKKVVITKIDHKPAHKETKPVKSILKKTSKIRGVRDPAKSPPLKPGMRKHTLRMFTERGLKKHRKTMKHKIAKMKKSDIDKILAQSDVKLNPDTPPSISKKILNNAISSGFVSLP
jgi:hypothetical protein